MEKHASKRYKFLFTEKILSELLQDCLCGFRLILITVPLAALFSWQSCCQDQISDLTGPAPPSKELQISLHPPSGMRCMNKV